MENEQLKQTVDLLSRRLEELQALASENTLLKSSIIQFRQDFQRQAHRYMQHQQHMRHFQHDPSGADSSSQSQLQLQSLQSLQTSHDGGVGPERERVLQLEAELSRLHEENRALRRQTSTGQR